MKILINLLKFILIAILTICMISIGFISIASLTIFDKNYVIQKLEETDFYSGIHELVEYNFENYIYQSGLDENVLENICTNEKVMQDINIILSNIYDGTDQKVDTVEIANNLNNNIEKSGIKNSKNESSINQFVTHICNEYTNTLIHTKYEGQINTIYNKILDRLNQVYNITSTVLVLDVILIIVINIKKIYKNVQYFGIALLATSIFELCVWQIIISKIDIKGIKIFNDVFSHSIVIVIQDIIQKIVSLSLGTMFISIICIGIYVGIITVKKSKSKDEKHQVKTEEV